MEYTVCYGKSIDSIAEDLGITKPEAQEVYDKIMNSFVNLKKLMDDSQDMARRLGYVETIYGRRRHIPDMQLEPYEVISTTDKYFDPFFDSKELGVETILDKRINMYKHELLTCFWKKRPDLKAKIVQDGFKVIENTKRIGDATRQCVNCVDAMTKILTSQGWKNWFELKKGDMIQTYNLTTHQLEWQPLIKRNLYRGEFNMFHIKKKGIDCLCTPEHKFLDISKGEDRLVPLSEIEEIITFTKNRHDRYVRTMINKSDIKPVTTRSFVWCPTTPNGTWVAERNGTVYITGNSIIQGSAADLSKLAMYQVGKNPRLKELDFRLLLMVHDELIGECPEENVPEVSKLLSEIMVGACKDLKVPMHVDVDVSYRWYENE